jgi:hypothetical protein
MHASERRAKPACYRMVRDGLLLWSQERALPGVQTLHWPEVRRQVGTTEAARVSA